MPRLEFLFDFISPYAYLAWHRLPATEAWTGVRAQPVPILFAGLLNHHGQLGPAEIPAKRSYMFKDALRRAAQAGLTLKPPPAHPFNPLLALRLASLDLDEALRRRVIDGLFEVAWGGARPAGPEAGLDQEGTVRGVLAGIVDAATVDRMMTAITEAEAKERLRQRTAAAIAAGTFGVPTFLATDEAGRQEVFWGYDSIDLVVRFLTEGDLLEDTAVERWRTLPAAAVRRR